MPVPTLLEPAIRRHLAAIVCLFAGACVLGWLVPGSMIAPVLRGLAKLVEPVRGMPHAQLFVFILAHNALATFFMMLAGTLFGITAILFAVTNGIMLGVIVHLGAQKLGAAQLAGGILPHGVFELPAAFLAASYGLWLGTGLIAQLRGKATPSMGERIRHAVRRYLMIVLPLLIVAAAIESTLISRLPR